MCNDTQPWDLEYSCAWLRIVEQKDAGKNVWWCPEKGLQDKLWRTALIALKTSSISSKHVSYNGLPATLSYKNVSYTVKINSMWTLKRFFVYSFTIYGTYLLLPHFNILVLCQLITYFTLQEIRMWQITYFI